MSAPETKPAIVLARVLRVLQPLVRLLVRQGVTYPALATALKQVFVDAAQAELNEQGMARTDSAITLLSGVHRRDVRTLTRGAAPARQAPAPMSLAAEVVARWMSEPLFLQADGSPRPLPRSGEGTAAAEPVSFGALVAGVSSDVRARAVLDELLRLGVVHEDERGVHLHGAGFAPQQGFDEMAWLFADNLHDHAAAAATNLQGRGNFLEQAVWVDQITPASAARVQAVAVQAWQQAFRQVMAEAQQRFEADATDVAPPRRRERARFGVYFYSAPMADDAGTAPPVAAPAPDTAAPGAAAGARSRPRTPR
jgi:hypothetical protein